MAKMAKSKSKTKGGSTGSSSSKSPAIPTKKGNDKAPKIAHHHEVTAVDTCLRPWDKRAEFSYRKAVAYEFKQLGDKFTKAGGNSYYREVLDPLKVNEGRRFAMQMHAKPSEHSTKTVVKPQWKIDAHSFSGTKNGDKLCVFIRDSTTNKVVAIIQRPDVAANKSNSWLNGTIEPAYHIYLPQKSYPDQQLDDGTGADESIDNMPQAVKDEMQNSVPFYVHARINMKWNDDNDKPATAEYTVFQSNKFVPDITNFAHEMPILRTELKDDSGAWWTGGTIGSKYCAGGKTWKILKPWHPSLIINPPHGDTLGIIEITDDEQCFLNMAEMLAVSDDRAAEMDRLRLFLNTFCVFDACLARKSKNIHRAERNAALATAGTAAACYMYSTTPDVLAYDGYLMLSQAVFTGVGACVGSAYTLFQIGKFYLYGAEAVTRTVHAVGAEPFLPAIGAAGGSIYLANVLLVQPILKPVADMVLPVVKPLVEPAVAQGMQILTQAYDSFFRPGGARANGGGGGNMRGAGSALFGS